MALTWTTPDQPHITLPNPDDHRTETNSLPSSPSPETPTPPSPEPELTSTQAAAETLSTDKCFVCNFDLCHGFVHTDCGTAQEPAKIEDLLPDRHCIHGAVEFRQRFEQYKSNKDHRPLTQAFTYTISRCHPTYFKSLIETLGLSDQLTPLAVARIILLDNTEQSPDNTELGKVHKEVIHNISIHHPDLKTAFNENKICNFVVA